MNPEDYSELIAPLAPVRPVEVVPVSNAAGRITSTDIRAPRSVPAFAASAMDGFALDEEALESARSSRPIRVVGDVPAGHAPSALEPGCAVRVMTGAPVPTGTEAVIPVELTDASPTGPAPESIRIDSLPSTLRTGWNIRPVGEDGHRDDILLSAGARITAAGIGTLAMFGITEIDVLRAPRIGVIVTGDEIRSTDAHTLTEAAGPQIFNSNLPMLAAAVRGLGATAVEATCSDDTDELLAILSTMETEADLVVTTGGISAGAFEVVRQTLEAEHSTFRRLQMRPGAPQGFGRFGRLPLLHLPGTPQGAFVGFHLFAAALVSGTPLRHRWRRGVLAGAEIRCHRSAVTFRPGTFTEAGEIEAADRARLPTFATADAIIRIPRSAAGTGAETLAPGTVIDYLTC